MRLVYIPEEGEEVPLSIDVAKCRTIERFGGETFFLSRWIFQVLHSRLQQYF